MVSLSENFVYIQRSTTPSNTSAVRSDLLGDTYVVLDDRSVNISTGPLCSPSDGDRTLRQSTGGPDVTVVNSDVSVDVNREEAQADAPIEKVHFNLWAFLIVDCSLCITKFQVQGGHRVKEEPTTDGESTLLENLHSETGETPSSGITTTSCDFSQETVCLEMLS